MTNRNVVRSRALNTSQTQQCLGSRANYIGIVMQFYSFSIDIAEVFTCINIQGSGFSLGNMDCCTLREMWRQYVPTTQRDMQKILCSCIKYLACYKSIQITV